MHSVYRVDSLFTYEFLFTNSTKWLLYSVHAHLICTLFRRLKSLNAFIFHTDAHSHRFQCIVHLSINHLNTKWCLLMLRCCSWYVCWIFPRNSIFRCTVKNVKACQKNVKYIYIHFVHSVHCKYIMRSILRVLFDVRVIAARQRSFNSEMLLRSPKTESHIHMYTMQSHKWVDIAQIFEETYNIHYEMVTYGAFAIETNTTMLAWIFELFYLLQFTSLIFTSCEQYWAWYRNAIS